MHDIEEQINRLRKYSAPESLELWDSLDHNCRAAVLVLLYVNKYNQLSSVLTVRSNRLRTYPGQAAFPGGRCDFDTEGPWETALREADEEIGFKADKWESFEKLTTLPVYLSRSRLLVLPCIGFVAERGIELNQLATKLSDDEVAAAYTVDMKRLFTDLHYASESVKKHSAIWYNHIFRIMTAEEGVEWISTDPSDTKKVHTDIVGLTANILLDCARVAHGSNPTFNYLEDIGYERQIRLQLPKLNLVFKKRGLTSRFSTSEEEQFAQ